MKKLIFISLVIFFVICSSSWGQDKIDISDGIWRGSLPISGNVLCGALLNKIVIKNNKVAVKGWDIFGPINYKFNLNENKYENKFFKINNYTNRYKFTYLEKEKHIKLSFSGACVGEGIFKLEENLSIKSRDHEKDTTRLEDMLVIAKTTCEEIGIPDTDPKYGKCVLTLLKKQGYEDLLADASKTCDEIGIPDTDPQYILCVLTIFKR